MGIDFSGQEATPTSITSLPPDKDLMWLSLWLKPINNTPA